LVAVAQARVLAELDVRGTCDRDHGLVTGSWLAREANLPVGACRSQVRTARTLRAHLPETVAAVTDGRLSVEHARVLAGVCNPRVVDRLAELQPEVIALAGEVRFDQWRSEVRHLVELLDQDGGYDPDRDVTRNRLHLTETLDGSTAITGTLVGDTALCVRDAIDAKADELYRRHATEHAEHPEIPIPSYATLRALALAELCRAGGAVDLNSTRPPRPEVTLVVHATEPSDSPAGHPPWAGRTTDRRGTPLADGTVRTLLCDPDLHPIIVDSLGVPLDHGRRVRLATPAQRRALIVRDGGCAFPGCTTPAQWCDAHHIDPYAAGGRTDLNRLVLLCRYHHGVTHRRGWSMTTTPDGWPQWTTPTGRTITSQRHGRRQRAPSQPRAA
jgi:hypothetical protein